MQYLLLDHPPGRITRPGRYDDVHEVEKEYVVARTLIAPKQVAVAYQVSSMCCELAGYGTTHTQSAGWTPRNMLRNDV